MLTIDGSFGEGGGQILRTSLALSLVTGKPIRIENIRAGRKKPGLMRQHLTAVNAAAEISRAEVSGNELGSPTLDFAPHEIKPGRYRFAVGTAGSCTLVLQTVLPALMTAGGTSELNLAGGTHNPFAPPFDFLVRTFIPVINCMGPRITATLERPGFYPAGGGKISVSIRPVETLAPVDLLERGEVKSRRARALVARLPRKIAERELEVIRRRQSFDCERLQVEEVADSHGPGNVLFVEIESDRITEVFSGFGRRGVPAERVAEHVAQTVHEYLEAEVPVGRHLADQLLIPFALAGGGKFRTLAPTRHTMTNIEVLKKFLDVEIAVSQLDEYAWEIEVKNA